MKLFISQVMIISGILLTGPLFCQISSEDIEANMMLANHYSYPYKLFKKGYLVQTPDTLDSLELPVLSKSKPDSANSHIKIGKTIGFAAMGFMSGLFFGATIVNFGMFQGPA
ncbi:MAG: hypothetical protein GWN00_11115, partial [Aliifodinibius sp.]|nr:hypothetical protein [Fodinibius sp.]NIY25335.1 hypothetical protein [Fodinibius sp.]